MKREKWLSCLIGTVLAFGISLAGTRCLLTAFDLKPVDVGAVTALCAVFAAVCAVCFSFRRGWLALVALAAALFGYLFREGILERELEALLSKITEYYNMGYGWGKISWSGADLGHVPVTGSLSLVGAMVAMIVAWTVCRRANAFFAVLLGFLPLAACFVVTDTIPEEQWVFLLLSCLCMLVLTQSVRRQDPKGAVRLTALLLVPVLLASGLLFWLNPQKDYEKRMKQTQQTLLSWLSDLPFVVATPDGELTVSIDGLQGARVDLASVGPKVQLRYAVMDVVAEKGGTIYLRGQSFDAYDGLNWSATEFASGEDPYFPSRAMTGNGRINISVRTAQGRMYVPYYVSEKYVLTDGYMANENRERDYSFLRMEPVTGQGTHLSKQVQLHDPIIQQCLRLPDRTRQKANAILNEIGVAATQDAGVYSSNTSLAQKIRNYVSGSALYDLETPQMPQGETDFALWFLEQSETGYCVHFASATTVLLRAAGIPARYVTGYMFEAQDGTRVTVRSNAAHAWVEYFDYYNGWTVLDATPAEWLQEQEEETTETQPVVTEPTTEPTTQPPTEETQPSTENTEPEPTEGNDTPGDDENKVDLGWLWVLLEYLAYFVGAIAVIAGQYSLRKSLRRKKLKNGHRNTRALAYRRYAGRMARLSKTQLPERLEFLAEKAKFSQHTLTVQELMEFELWVRQAEDALLEKPWPVKLAIKLIWAI